MSVDACLLRLAGVRIFEVDDIDEGALYVVDTQVLLLDAHLETEDRRTSYERVLSEVSERISLDEL